MLYSVWNRIFVLFCAIILPASAFVLNTKFEGSWLALQANNEDNGIQRGLSPLDSDRSLLNSVDRRQAILTSLFTAAGISLVNPQGAHAESLEKANKILRKNGIVPIMKVPDGLVPLVEYYGQYGDDRQSVLVQFFYPTFWVPSKPNVNPNGEDGTVSAGQYAKGDSATFVVLSDYVPKGETLSADLVNDKAFFAKAIAKAISIKGGDNLLQNFKVSKLELNPEASGKDQNYFIAQVSYELVTGSNFLVDRKGYAAVTSTGNGDLQLLPAVTTAIRFKNLDRDLKEIVKSFRVYDGIAKAI